MEGYHANAEKGFSVKYLEIAKKTGGFGMDGK